MADELDELQPEERLKKLKELEEEKKKEIEEAKKEIKKAEREITAKDEWKRKVPIPEVAKEKGETKSSEELSEEGKELVKRHRGYSEDDEEGNEESEGEDEESEENSENLEEALALVGEIPGEMGPTYETEHSGLTEAYVSHLSQEPMADLYNKMADINAAVAERGYITPDEQREVYHILVGVERKAEDVHAGNYPVSDGSLSDRLAHEINITQQMGETLRQLYLSHMEQIPEDRYKAGK